MVLEINISMPKKWKKKITKVKEDVKAKSKQYGFDELVNVKRDKVKMPKQHGGKKKILVINKRSIYIKQKPKPKQSFWKKV